MGTSFSKGYLIKVIFLFFIKLPLLLIFFGWYFFSYLFDFNHEKDLKEIKIDVFDKL